jgi:hypothetical protein
MTRHRGSHTPPVAPPEELPEPVMAVPVLAPGLWFWDGGLLVPDKDIPDARPEDVPVPADIPVPPPLAPLPPPALPPPPPPWAKAGAANAAAKTSLQNAELA